MTQSRVYIRNLIVSASRVRTRRSNGAGVVRIWSPLRNRRARKPVLVAVIVYREEYSKSHKKKNYNHKKRVLSSTFSFPTIVLHCPAHKSPFAPLKDSSAFPRVPRRFQNVVRRVAIVRSARRRSSRQVLAGRHCRGGWSKSSQQKSRIFPLVLAAV